MGIVITLILVVLAVLVMARAVSRAKQQAVGHNRCAYCRTHLRRNENGTGFATTCRKCGRDQPWAVT